MQTSLLFVFLPLPTPNARGISTLTAIEETVVLKFDLHMRQSVAGSASLDL